MLTNPPFALNLTPEPTVPRNVLYRNAGGGFGSQSSQLSDILVDVEGEGGEGGKVKRACRGIGTRRKARATSRSRSRSRARRSAPPYCVLSGTCLGHPKCYQKGTRFDGYCFIHARADAMGDYSGNWSDGSDWGLDGDERAWRAKYSSPNRHSESESEGEAEGEGEGED